VSAQVIADICKRAVENKLPADASVIRVVYNGMTNNFDVIVHSEEFPEVQEGSIIPKVDKLPVVANDMLK